MPEHPEICEGARLFLEIFWLSASGFPRFRTLVIRGCPAHLGLESLAGGRMHLSNLSTPPRVPPWISIEMDDLQLDDRSRIVASLVNIGRQLDDMADGSSSADRDRVSHLIWLRDSLKRAIMSNSPAQLPLL